MCVLPVVVLYSKISSREIICEEEPACGRRCGQSNMLTLLALGLLPGGALLRPSPHARSGALLLSATAATNVAPDIDEHAVRHSLHALDEKLFAFQYDSSSAAPVVGACLEALHGVVMRLARCCSRGRAERDRSSKPNWENRPRASRPKKQRSAAAATAAVGSRA